jgi:hypothetical protein
VGCHALQSTPQSSDLGSEAAPGIDRCKTWHVAGTLQASLLTVAWYSCGCAPDLQGDYLVTLSLHSCPNPLPQEDSLYNAWGRSGFSPRQACLGGHASPNLRGFFYWTRSLRSCTRSTHTQHDELPQLRARVEALEACLKQNSITSHRLPLSGNPYK